MSDLIVTRCACCQQPLGLEPRIAGLSAELDHMRDCLADDQVFGLAQKNRADLAEAREKQLRAALSLIYREADVPDVNEVAFRVRNLVRNALEGAVGP